MIYNPTEEADSLCGLKYDNLFVFLTLTQIDFITTFTEREIKQSFSQVFDIRPIDWRYIMYCCLYGLYYWAYCTVSGGGEQSYSSRRAQTGPMVLPSASRASRGGAYDEDAVPRHPPYVAYISNLPYEVDEESIAELFTGLKVGYDLTNNRQFYVFTIL